ncbi:MAG: pilus assembly protein [Ruminococcus sp.]|nr:pilus assembly protein [Ruminococcus sp.]
MKERKYVKGVLTVEMSYLIPLILSIILLIIYAVFYYHDKNILNGAAAETAVLCAQIERRPEGSSGEDLNSFFRERIAGKLIFFSDASMELEKTEDEAEVVVQAQKGRMTVHICRRASIVKPEDRIRKKRILENLTGQEG